MARPESELDKPHHVPDAEAIMNLSRNLNAPFPPTVPELPREHSDRSLDEVFSNSADESETELIRTSRRQRLTQSFRKRSASIKSNLSFTKKEKKDSDSSFDLCSRPNSRSGSVPPLSASTANSPRHSSSQGASHSSSNSSISSGQRISPTRHSEIVTVLPTCTELSPEELPLRQSPEPLAGGLSPQSAAGTEIANKLSQFRLAQPPIMAARKQSSSLDPGAAYRRQSFVEHTNRTQQMAVKEEHDIRQAMAKKGHQFPHYRFLDFIGKGTYGRVFHAHDLSHDPPLEVAIKIMNIDDVDYEAHIQAKDDALNDVRKEIQVLMQLKDHGAQNVNLILDVLEVERYLWLVCEFCPGGSLRTLLRATSYRCPTKYMRTIARELARGIRSIHDANIIHRDLKAANVMIHKAGGLQIIDFGVAGMVESKADKRKTRIGTPFWMPPEQHGRLAQEEKLHYGFEVDIWSYAVTLYEIATGAPPHSKLPANRLETALKRNPPRLSENEFPKDLCQFIEYVAQTNPLDRPSVHDILEHPYLVNSDENLPTSVLTELVTKFEDWHFSGGQRTSLFAPSGAQSAMEYESGNDMSDEIDFIFGTSRDLAAGNDSDLYAFSTQFEDVQPSPTSQDSSFSDNSELGSLDDFAMDPQDDFTSRPAKHTLQQSFGSESRDPSNERRVVRGGHALEAIFNAKQQPYGASRPKSDLPLRDSNDSSDLARKEVDYNQTSASRSEVELADADTIKSKRKQQAKDRQTISGWQFDYDNIEANMNNDADTELDPQTGPPSAFPLRPTLMHAETAPDQVTQMSQAQSRASTATMDLDDLMGDELNDWQSNSAMGRSPTGLSTPLDDEDMTIRHNITDLTDSSFPSYASSVTDTSASEDESITAYDHEVNDYTRGRKPVQYSNMHADIQPPSAEAMRDDAPPEVVEMEMRRLLSGFMGELAAIADEFPTEKDVGDGEQDLEEEDGPETAHENTANGNVSSFS
ncbi:uncharacterized protein KY384_008443 [Bacidia gigantensis]|uniref:uncharacterized protein n=1 Tax=Bacidia gigantensis TaxID=2732470 RepID=UPI001D04C913|nr:uncharacterized protein KY384_008443 [Bacidia gigantensis]KAG8527014.1 hypothetical protein KY384_008443 [Bacidia gigantensis]